MAGKNCKFGDVKCLLQGTPLGPVAKALDKPWQVATSVASVALKGTPLEQTAAAFNQASHGDVKGSIAKQAGGIIDIVKAYVPGVGSVPGIGLATDLAKTVIDNAVNPKKAGGAALAAAGINIPSVAQVAAMVGPNSPLAPLLKPTSAVSQAAPPLRAPPPPIKEVRAIVAETGQVKPLTPLSVPVGASRFKPKPARVFTRDQWVAHVNDPRTVGGTQPYSVP